MSTTMAVPCFNKLRTPTREGRTVFLVLHDGHHKDGWDEEREASVDASDVLFIEALHHSGWPADGAAVVHVKGGATLHTVNDFNKTWPVVEAAKSHRPWYRRFRR